MNTLKETSSLKAVGPYSLARESGGIVFCAGQIGVVAGKGLVPGGTQAEFKQAVQNVRELLEAAGSGLKNIVRVVVYLVDMAEYKDLNEAYAQEFVEPFPARTTVQVAALPLGARVEIEVTAAIK